MSRQDALTQLAGKVDTILNDVSFLIGVLQDEEEPALEDTIRGLRKAEDGLATAEIQLRRAARKGVLFL